MHIMEGFLPIEWCIFWFIISAPVLVWGFLKIRRYLQNEPQNMMGLAIGAAFIFILSSLKLPSVVGSSSHPTGTGFSAIAYGPGVTSVFSLIVLIFQALLLAHGGLTTLGANVFSMGIAGPAVAFAVFKLVKRVNFSASVFLSATIADLFTYVITSLQLALAFPGQNFIHTMIGFLAIFAITQVPLAIIEGIVFTVFVKFVVSSRPALFGNIFVKTKETGVK